MQNEIDQLSAAVSGFGPVAWAVLGAVTLVMVGMGLVLGMVLRRPRNAGGERTGEPGALGACGAATFACRVTPSLKFAALSADIETITGYTSQVLTESDAFLRMLDEQDAAMFENKARNAVQSEIPFVSDVRYEDADGQKRWLQIRAEIARDGRGKSRGLCGVVKEITEQKRLATDAADAWARFNAIANATPTMLWVLDVRGDCQAINSATERFAGMNEAQLLGTGWTRSIPEDERQAVMKFVSRSVEERTSLKRDSAMIDGSGRVRLVSLSTSVARDDQGQVSGVVVTGKDVTDRSEGDKQLDRLRQIVDVSDQHVAILAPDMRVTTLNTQARTVLGLGERDSADSLALWHLVTKDTSDEIRTEGIKACAEQGVWHGRGMVRTGEDTSVASELTVTSLGDGWHGLIARPIEHELRREADAALDKRRLAVAMGALEKLGGGGWAPGRAAERIVESVARHYTHLRATYATFTDEGRIIVEASDGPAWMGSAKGRVVRVDPDGTLYERLRSDEIVKVVDVWDEPAFEDSLLAFEQTATRSIAAVVVDAGDRSAGLMLFEKAEASDWTPDEVQTLRLASGVLGVALRSERDRRARMAAEARAAEQTQRWREERTRCEELSALASDRAGEAERLESKLARVDQAWAGGLAELGKRAMGASELAASAREQGQTKLAEGLENLAIDADRAEIAGRLVSGTLKPRLEACQPAAVLRHVGERFVGKAKARGVTLKITQEGKLPESIEADQRLVKLACCELLDVALARCSTREMVAVASVRGEEPDRAMVVRIKGGPVASPTDAAPGAPTGLSLLRQLAEVMGGKLDLKSESGETELALVLPLAQEASLNMPEQSDRADDGGDAPERSAA